MDQRLWRNFDWFLLAIVIALVLFGLLALAGATQLDPADPSTWDQVQRQALWVGVAFVGLLVTISIDYTQLAALSNLMYWLNLALLGTVLVAGSEALGATRWIDVGPFQFQPSEFAKLFVIISLASLLAKREGEMQNWEDLIAPVVHILPPMGLILVQPDLGTSLVLVAILAGMLYMAGVPGRRLLLLGGAGLGVAVLAIYGHLQWGLPLPLKEYQLNRLIIFLDPSRDVFGAGYNVIQSRMTIGSGKLWGQGLFTGEQSRLNYLPEQETDFIFSVVGETFGFVGGALLILLFALLLWRGLHIASQAKDLLGSLLAVGVVSMITFHVVVNIGMTMGIMPVTGLPLPFISKGGSAILTNMVAVGLLLNVHMRRQKIMF